MDKKTKKIIGTFTVMVCAAALILGGYYMLSRGKLGKMRDTSSTSTEVEKLLAKDLETKYPETPTEVVKLYWRYNKCMYNRDMQDKEFQGLLKQLRKLYDAELLDMKENSWENMLNQFEKDRSEYLKKDRVITTYAVQPNSTVQYNTVDGKERAVVIAGAVVKVKSKREQVYEKFICQKDSDGNWKILGWSQTTDKDEISLVTNK